MSPTAAAENSHDALQRVAEAHRVKGRVAELGWTPATIAEKTRLSEGHVRNLLGGFDRSRRGRQAIVDCICSELPEWPGIEPRDSISAEDRATIDRALRELCQLGHALYDASSEDERDRINSEALRILSGDFLGLLARWHRVSQLSEWPLLFSAIAPFGRLLLKREGMPLPEPRKPGEPYRITIGR